MVLITSHAVMRVFNDPYQCVFPYVISGMVILSGECRGLTLEVLLRNSMSADGCGWVGWDEPF